MTDPKREPKRRGRLWRYPDTLYAVYADHGDRVCRFVAMCRDRTDAETQAANLTHVGDVYILAHPCERFWRAPVEAEVITPSTGLAVVPAK